MTEASDRQWPTPDQPWVMRQVWHDVLGLYPTAPRHARRFGEIGNAIEAALRDYVQAVQAGTFPSQPAKPPIPAKPVSVI